MTTPQAVLNFSTSRTPLDPKVEQEWDKRGFYQVGPHKHYSKLHAIMASQQTGHYPYWNFNDELFGQYDWTVEPEESLTSLYKRRAQQLRDKYDYLVLSYSSGSDSTNMLHSFLFNGIPIDDVICYGPFSTNQGRQNLNRDPEYNYREIDLLAIPYLQELSKKYNFKVTMYDWTNDVATQYKDTDWVWTQVSHRFAPSIVARNRMHMQPQHLNLVDRGFKVGFVFGIDKPRIVLKDNNYWCGFIDLCTSMSVGPGGSMTGNVWENDEYFYWTPDLPELTIKQAHLMMRFFETHPLLKAYIQDADLMSWPWLEEYYDIVKRVCYPTFNAEIFQTWKVRNGTLSENDNWFIKNSDLPAARIWRAGLDEVQSVIDPNWLIGGTILNGLVGAWSRMYALTK
jgi:hypothetical protein